MDFLKFVVFSFVKAARKFSKSFNKICAFALIALDETLTEILRHGNQEKLLLYPVLPINSLNPQLHTSLVGSENLRLCYLFKGEQFDTIP